MAATCSNITWDSLSDSTVLLLFRYGGAFRPGMEKQTITDKNLIVLTDAEVDTRPVFANKPAIHCTAK